MPPPFSRRRFLQGATLLGAGTALGACSGTSEPAAGPAATAALPLPTTGEGTLVLVTLYGGNDALNTVVPVLDDTYRSRRGALALDPAATLDLGEGFALHPNLVGCKQLWDAGRLAVVHGVGFAGLDRSHFHCMDVWQAGGADHLASGWLGRWLDTGEGGGDALDAVVVGRALPLLARGERRAAAVVPPGPFDLPGDDRLRGLLDTQSGPDAGRADLEALVARSGADLLAIERRVAPVLASSAAGETLDDRLGTVADLIDAGLPTRAYAVDLGGFDTHAQQAATHDALLAELDGALDAFLDRVGERSVTVAVYSEFGRRVAANASLGTDHGAAGTVLLAGTVRPGHHGEPPPLDALVAGDLATTVDFRAVYAGVLEGVLGIPADAVLGPGPAPLRLV